MSEDRTQLLFDAAPMGVSYPSSSVPTNSSSIPASGNISANPSNQPAPSIFQQSSLGPVRIWMVIYIELRYTVHLYRAPSLNVTGRLLVGLRWWNEIREDGTEEWIFESKPDRTVNPVDSRVFWTALYVAPALWVLFGVGAILKFSFSWLLVVAVALVLNMANVIGYTRCEKRHLTVFMERG
ncbi:Golgi apparatus membrane protein TVP23 A [Blyttiomyces sp. JEL0837]|nr:Golgi apparatus membrane protein TVP23 A [Blyttiomyces sp. JEL0837]